MPFDSFGAVDPDTRTLRAAMTVPPPPGRLWQIDQTIRQLKQHGIWQKLDVLWMLAAHNAQAARLNWKSPSQFALTAVNSPTFTSDRGYAGNGTTSYLDTGWNPATNGVQYTLNSGGVGVYLNSGTDTGDNAAFAIGSAISGGVGETTGLVPRSTTDTLRGRVNNTTSVLFSGVSVTTRYGLSVVDRSGSASTTGFKNGAGSTADTTASTAVPSASMFLGALNSGGSPILPVNNRIAFAYAGASLTAAQHAALYRITQNFLASMGAAV